MKFDFLDKLQEITKKTTEELIKNNKSDINIQSNKNLSKDEIELAKKLDAIEEFSIDRFEGNIAIIENRKNQNKIEIEKEKLPKQVKEGDIIKKINGKYILDSEKTINEKNRIKDKMNDLWN